MYMNRWTIYLNIIFVEITKTIAMTVLFDIADYSMITTTFKTAKYWNKPYHSKLELDNDRLFDLCTLISLILLSHLLAYYCVWKLKCIKNICLRVVQLQRDSTIASKTASIHF